MIKKVLVLLIIFLIPIITAELTVVEEPIIDTIIPELGNSAMFEFEITNLGERDAFRIYSLVGINMEYPEPLIIDSGKTKVVLISISMTMPETSQAREME